jgi:predicted helicase
VIFSTYQSSPLIAEAQLDQAVPVFDLAIADEAHRCAGKVSGDFSTILDGEKIRAKKRLFTTATPRTYSLTIPSIRRYSTIVRLCTTGSSA